MFFIAGYENKEIFEFDSEYEDIEHICKPFTPEELIKKINHVLEKYKNSKKNE